MTGASDKSDRAFVPTASSPQAVSPVPASIPSALPRVVAAVPEGLVWQHEVTIRGGRTEYQWALKGDRGGIHVSAWPDSSPSYGREWLGGIEGHSPIPRDWESDTPSHEHCWLLDGPCWHDGSSLQFSEQIAPYLPSPGEPMRENNHLDVLRVMASRYASWLPDAQAIEAGTGETREAGLDAQHESAVGNADAPKGRHP